MQHNIFGHMDLQLRLAIVEDNATARTNLRSHLLPFGCFDIHSFSNGNELRSALKRQPIDVVIIDYHLGQHKNGVECIEGLKLSGHIKPSTGVFFITADRAPKTIAQIMELHPDMLIVKPYTMGMLTKHIEKYLVFRQLVTDVLNHMDNGIYDLALRHMKDLILDAQPVNANTHRFMPELNKLFARLLVYTGFYSSAVTLYDSILQRSDKVLWAQWGKIKCQYLLGEWSACENILQHLVKTNLTRDKAFEWLACLSAERELYEQTSDFLENIKVTDLTMSATKLITLAYRKQNKVIEGIDLLQRQREHNRSTRDRFEEFTYELAEFYIAIAEETPLKQREESLSQARKLIGMAARGESDMQLKLKKDVLLAYSATLEGDNEKAQKLIGDLNMLALQSAQPSAQFCAAKVLFSIGHKENGKALLNRAEAQLEKAEDQTWRSVMTIGLNDSEKTLGLDQQKAVDLNEEGMVLFANKQAEKAMPLFFEAFQRIPTMPAFSLNLLQCLVELNRTSFRHITTGHLLEQLSQLSLNQANQQRLDRIQKLMARESC
ncbi:response regulator [Alteromonas sediminis]|uniref:Response regulator n=1 Tax=Alteromonas sediminis TaxID=2259342 RepID=A0A3N5Y356_9ALTE|nr:response regulator [Alteromonas sediminis]RPJ67553.1 response regulator [Alteromonas sediminis]